MASTYLSRTASAGNQKTFTISVWLKRSQINTSDYNTFFSSDVSASNSFRFTFNDDDGSADDRLMVYYYTGSHQLKLITNRQFRDTSAWYHIVLAVDTTQATSSDRVKIYVNGEQETSFSTATYPSQNLDTSVNVSGAPHEVGRGGGSLYYNGVMAHFHFIDGTAYSPSDFGETDATTGIWKPKTAPSVTYGTNGFFLKFENSGAFGTDSSGNANNFTVNGTMTQTIDTPSNVFATMNPLYQSVYGGSSAILTNGNTKWTGTSNDTSQNATLGTLGVSSGKWYWEVKGNMAYDSLLGIAKSNFDPNGGTGGLQNPGWWGLVTNISATSGSGLKFVVDNTFGSSTGITLANGDIINIALDATNLKFYIGKNGTWLNSGDPTSGATGTGSIATLPSDTTFLPACSNYGYNTANSWEFNFGNGYFGTTAVSSAENPDDGIGIFEYSVPTGYKALCTKSINAQEYD